MTKDKSVSVIINTHNRAWHLKRLLDALARQTYENFEVIVVNGPSDDNTNDILEMYKGAIRVETCPVVNLCVSRNIGLRASSGDIVAYIDDDAVPGDKYWIENAVTYFKDETIGAVGGEAKRINDDIEFSCGYFTTIGENFVVGKPNQDYNTPKGEVYNRVNGNNAIFIREAVCKIGGFDEYYVYFLDETDVCLRLIDEGYKVVHHPNALVYHEAAGGINRKSEYHLNWPVISRSLGYFVIKATEGRGFSKEEQLKIAKTSPTYLGWLDDFKHLLENKKISKEDYNEFMSSVKDGLQKGIDDGFAMEKTLDFSMALKKENFLKFDKSISKGFLNIVMLCEEDIIKPVGGVQMYTNMLAKEFVKKGHNVHIISKAEPSIMKNVDGMNIYTVIPEHLPISELEPYPNCQRITDFSYACHKKIKQLDRIYGIDIIETPIWDVNGLIPAHLSPIPVVTRLQTPLKMIMDTHKWEENGDMSLLIDYEKSLFLKSEGIIAISDSIKDTIEQLYDIKFTQPLVKNYLGINLETTATSSREPNDNRVIVFFIGRLERRKGIDSIIKAIPYIMERYPQVEFRLAGDCEIFDEAIGDTFKNKFLKENKGKKWLGKVTFMGKIDEAAKEQEFANCDIFIAPSLYESFGIIFIEAMRYAKPVIGCNAGAMPEIIENSVTGLLCEPGNGEDFTKALETLVKDKNLRDKMGASGVKKLTKHFTNEIMCEGSLSFYKELIAQKKM